MTVANPSGIKLADTDADVHDLIAERWSPRGFDPGHVLTHDQVDSLLEAARWAPSAANSQPWHFIVGIRGDAAHAKIYASLTGGNPSWAHTASALLVAVAGTPEIGGRPNGTWAAYDLGQSAAWLTVQAHHLGLHVHQMGGFDADGIRSAFEVPADATPYAVISIGVPTADHDLPEKYAELERSPRVRKPRAEFVHGERWTAADDVEG